MKYEEPTIEVIRLDDDVIRTSPTDVTDDMTGNGISF